MRAKLDITGGMPELVATLSEGNPGAVNVLMALLEVEGSAPGLVLWLDLDDMNIRGSQIWQASKWAGGDIAKLAVALRDRDPDMVTAINLQSKTEGMQERAVTSGASYTHEPQRY